MLCDDDHIGDSSPRVFLPSRLAGIVPPPINQERDMHNQISELSFDELNTVAGGDIRRSQIIPGYKEPTVLYDDGINIRTTGLFHSNVGYDSPFTPIPA
jgi:hypothetical protein